MLADPPQPDAPPGPPDPAPAPAFADPLDPAAIRAGLPGWHATVVQATGSTNTDLLHAARQVGGVGPPRLLACEAQSDGRGRLGRRWSSTPGASLTMSVSFGLPRRLSDLDGLTLACGLAVLDVVRAHGVAAGLKWPNDLVVGDAKLAGILVEAQAAGPSTTVVIGVGLNVKGVDAGANAGALAATSLAAERGGALERNRLAVEVALALERRVDALVDTGFAPMVDEWNHADAWRDRPVRLHAAGGDARRGIARGVDATGALRLDVGGVIERVISGDLSLRIDDPA